MDRYFLKTKAFSLVELSIAMGVMAMMVSTIAPMVVRSVEIKAGEKTITEISIIQEAAKKYQQDHHQWPADLVKLQQDGYVSPLWSLQNPWNNFYQISSDANTLSVSIQVPANLVQMLKQRLPASSNIGQVVTSVIGVALGGDQVPAGVIVAWSGAIDDIPSGWGLCDGSNGTPDLRDRFIVGANADLAGVAQSNILGTLTKSGGTISHNHSGFSGAHVLTIDEMPKHHHGYLATPWTGGRYDGHSSPLMTQQVAGNTDDAGGNQPHTHSISSDFNVPPYYALAYIIKL